MIGTSNGWVGWFYLFVVLECGDLGEAPVAEGAVVRLLPGVGAHVALQTGGFEESLPAVAAEVGPLVVVLLPVQDCAVPVTELPPTVLALQTIRIITIKIISLNL